MMCWRKRLAAISVLLLLAILATNCSPAVIPNTGTAYQKPSIITLDAKPAEITKGSATTLVWNVTGATKVTFDQKIGNVQSSGKISVTPDTTITYTLVASNNNGNMSQSITVKVNPASPASQSSRKPTTTENTAAATAPSQTFCRDGVCTFFMGKLYSIDYPDTWKESTIDAKTIGLFLNDSYSANIEIEINGPIGATPLKQVADQYTRDFLSRGNNSFYVGDSRALAGNPWDWYIDSSFSMGGPVQCIRVYYKNTDSNLYRLRAFATRYGLQFNPFTSDYDKIINSFKLLP